MNWKQTYQEIQDMGDESVWGDHKELITEFFEQYPNAPSPEQEPFKFEFLVRSFLYYKGVLRNVRR
jgi:hypothetical protein